MVKLRKGQSVKMELVTRKGIGKYHAKWQPMATTVFHYKPHLRFDQEIAKHLSLEQKTDFVKSCPQNVFKMDIEDTVQIVNEKACIFCDECVAKAREIDKVGLMLVNKEQDTFNFTVESIGQRPPEDLVRAALKILERKFKDVEHLVAETQEERQNEALSMGAYVSKDRGEEQGRDPLEQAIIDGTVIPRLPGGPLFPALV